MFKNVFRGESGIKSFLNPHEHLTPLVELSPELNPFFHDNVHIFIKMQTFLPLMNVKSVPAFEMITNNKKNCANLIESSSGNMAFSLSILSKHCGFRKMRSIVSSESSLEKVQMLLLSGSEIQVNEEPICPNPHDENSGISLAKKMGKKINWCNLNQYSNLNNPVGHYKITGEEIKNQLENDIQLFYSSLGTTGSMTGISEVLKNANSALKTIGVVRKPNNPVPGPRTLNLLKMIDFDWQKSCNEIISCSTFEAYAKSLELCRNGLLVGPSSGMNYYGVLKHLKHLKVKDELDSLRNEKGEINAVFLGCDLPFIYLDDYFKFLPRRMFPKITHQEKLHDQPSFAFEKKGKESLSLSSAKALKNVFHKSSIQLWKALKNKASIECDKDWIMIDLRRFNQFNCGQIPNSIHFEEKELINNLQNFSAMWENKKVLFICEYGELSYHLAKIYKAQGIEAYSLLNGFSKWSELNFPRISQHCQIL
ncbi:MAG: pyridoxal-phosphate dependent enzyme [Alphaproteobacteria bacterium]|nr:pyridoxal-phosphate dependent enzyme [Alphaproteobacteria bacterium]